MSDVTLEDLQEISDHTGEDLEDIADRLGVELAELLAEVDLGADGAAELGLDLDDPEQFADAWEMAYGDVDYVGDADKWDELYAHDDAMADGGDVNEHLQRREAESAEIEEVLDLIRQGHSVEEALEMVHS